MKVIGIGLPRTGTASLVESLKLLGLRAVHFDTTMIARHWRGGVGLPEERFDPLRAIGVGKLDELDATADFPACLPAVWSLAEARWGSDCRFVHTVRPEAAWIESVLSHVRHPWLRRQLRHRRRLGMPPGPLPTCDALGAVETVFECEADRIDADVCVTTQARHETLASEIDRSRVLHLDVSVPDALQRLATFLGRSAPDSPMPLVNRRPPRWARLIDTIRYHRQ